MRIATENATVIPATLNNSDTAQAFIEMLPYTINLSNYGNDFCGVMESPLPYKEEDVHPAHPGSNMFGHGYAYL